MAVKAIVDALRSAEGYAGAAIYADGRELFAERMDPEYAAALLCMMNLEDARRVSLASMGFTFTAFTAGGFIAVLKQAGRFPPAPDICPVEPDFANPSGMPALPSRADARREAEASLRQLGLL